MNAIEHTGHDEQTGRTKEAWGRAADDEGIEVEGQLEQVHARAEGPGRGDDDDFEDTVENPPDADEGADPNRGVSRPGGFGDADPRVPDQDTEVPERRTP